MDVLVMWNMDFKIPLHWVMDFHIQLRWIMDFYIPLQASYRPLVLFHINLYNGKKEHMNNVIAVEVSNTVMDSSYIETTHIGIQLKANSLEKKIHNRWNNIKALCVVIGQKNAGANRIIASTLHFWLLNYRGSNEL